MVRFSAATHANAAAGEADEESNFHARQGLEEYAFSRTGTTFDPKVRQINCMQQKWVWLSLMVMSQGRR